MTRQATDYTCGVAALQSVLAYYGEEVREDVLSKRLKANSKNGTNYRNIAELAQKHGYTVTIKQNMTLSQLKKSLDAGAPTICLIQAWTQSKTDFSNDWNDGHYVVAIGYDNKNFYFMDPSTLGNYTYIPSAEFEQRWHDREGTNRLLHFGMSLKKGAPHYDPAALKKLE